MFTPEERDLLLNSIRAQERIREEAFLRDEYGFQLAGVKVRPITLLDTHKLKYLGNKLFVGGVPTEEDAAQVIYLLQRRDWRNLFIKRSIAQIGRMVVLNGGFFPVYDFVNESFCDLAEGGGGGSNGESKDIPFTLFTYEVVDLLAREYGWAETDILNMPIPRVAQYINIILMREGGERPVDLFSKTKLRILERRNSNK